MLQILSAGKISVEFHTGKKGSPVHAHLLLGYLDLPLLNPQRRMRWHHVSQKFFEAAAASRAGAMGGGVDRDVAAFALQLCSERHDGVVGVQLHRNSRALGRTNLRRGKVNVLRQTQPEFGLIFDDFELLLVKVPTS